MAWKYYLPNGDYYTVPDNISKEAAEDEARRRNPELFAPPESTIGGAFSHGFQSLLSEGQELVEMPFLGVDEAAARAARRERELVDKYGTGASFADVGKKYEEEGPFSAAGEIARQSAMAIAGGVPYMAEMGVGALAGPVGLAAAAYAPRLARNIQEQAAKDIEEGRPVDVEAGKAAAYAAPEAALDVAAQAIPLGKNIAGKIFGPKVAALLGAGERTEAEQAALDAVISERGIWKSMGRGVAKNLVAQELIQPSLTVLDRLQNDEDLTSDDALAAYGNAMYMAGIMSPLGAVEGVSERSAAKGRIAKREEERQAAILKAEEEKPGVDEATGQETFAPGIFTYDQEKWEANAPKKAEEEATAGEPPPEVGPSPQMPFDFGLRDIEEQRDLFAGEKEPKQPPTQLDMFGEPEVAPEPEITPIYEPGMEERPVAPPNSAQMGLPLEDEQRGFDFGEAAPPISYDTAAEAAQRAVESPISARNQVEREANRALDVERYIGENEGQMPLPFDELGGKVPETTAVEAPAEKTPHEIARAKALQAIVDADKATIALVKEATGYSTPKAKALLDEFTNEGILSKPDGTTARKLLRPVKQLEMDLSEPLPARTPRGGEQVEMFSPEETYSSKPFSIKDLSDEQLADIYGAKQAEDLGGATVPHSGQKWLPGTEPSWQHLYDLEAEKAQSLAGDALRARVRQPISNEEPTNVTPSSQSVEPPTGQLSSEGPVGGAIPGSVEQPVQRARARQPSVAAVGGQGLAANKPVTPVLARREEARAATLKAQEDLARMEQQRIAENKAAAQTSETIKRAETANALQEQLDEIIDDIHPKKADRIQSAIEQVRRGVRTADEVAHLLSTAQETRLVPDESLVGRGQPKAVSTPSLEDLFAKVESYAPRKPKAQMGETVGRGVSHETALDIATGIVSKWKDAPLINVVDRVEDLPEHIQAKLTGNPKTYKGLYDSPTKTVHIISSNVDAANPHASIKATVFHESLGHFGLERAFGNGLDAVLSNLYKTNQTVRKYTHEWLGRNYDAYKDSLDGIPRAVEETLATLSEQKEFKAPTGIHLAFNKVADFIRGFLERMGLKRKDYGKEEMREIISTLQRAHESVISGKETKPAETVSRDASPTLRYQRQSEGILQDDIPEDTGTGKAAASARKIQEARAAGNPKEELERYGDADIHAVRLTPTRKEQALDALSRMNTKTWDAVQDLYSLHQKFELYGDKMPSIELLDNRLGARKAELNTKRNALNAKGLEWVKTIQKYEKQSPLVVKNFFDIALKSTLDQVEFFNRPKKVGPDGTTIQMERKREDNPLTKRFEALPQDLRDMYKNMRDDFENEMGSYIEYMASKMKKDEATAFRKEFFNNRLGVYLPLFRKGEFWLSYTDKANNIVKSSFNSEFQRDLEVIRAKKAGIKNIETYRNIKEMRESSAPPAGFLGKIISTLKDQKITDPDTLDALYETYLDYVSPNSIKQRTRGREGYAGMEADIVNSYINVMDTTIRATTNVKHALGIDEAMYKIQEEALKNRGDERLARVASGIQKQADFIRNPKINRHATMAGYTSYMWYLAGNASSAIIDLTHVPTVVYPVLGGKYGWGAASAALKKATSAVQFRYDDVAPKGYERLYHDAVEAGAVGVHAAKELFDMKKTSSSNYTGLWAKTKKGLDYMFHMAGKLNRETTLVAAYELALKNNTPEAARVEAIRFVKHAYGAMLAETGPRIMQNNVARVLLTFKQFAMNRAYIMGSLMRDFYKAEDAHTRWVATQQILGVYGMAFAFAGVAGMPLVGAGEFLANQLMGDDDEPYDASARVRTAAGDWAYKGPIAHALNLAVSERIGWNDMLFRDDPRKLADSGVVDYTLTQMMGPIYGVFAQLEDAKGYYDQGKYERMFETMLPSVLRNVLKGVRYMQEDAQTITGKPIGEVSAYNAFMQMGGFAPEDINIARQKATSIDVAEGKINSRRRALFDQAEGAIRTGNSDELQKVMASIQKFNDTYPTKQILMPNVMRAVKNAIKEEHESVLGINPDRKLRAMLMAQQGLDPYGEPLEE